MKTDKNILYNFLKLECCEIWTLMLVIVLMLLESVRERAEMILQQFLKYESLICSLTLKKMTASIKLVDEHSTKNTAGWILLVISSHITAVSRVTSSEVFLMTTMISESLCLKTSMFWSFKLQHVQSMLENMSGSNAENTWNKLMILQISDANSHSSEFFDSIFLTSVIRRWFKHVKSNVLKASNIISRLL